MKITVSATNAAQQEHVTVEATRIEDDWIVEIPAAIQITEAWQDDPGTDEARGWYSGDRDDDPIVLARYMTGTDHRILHEEWETTDTWTAPTESLDFGEPVSGFPLSAFPGAALTATTTEETHA